MLRTITQNIFNVHLPTIGGSGVLDLSNVRKCKTNGSVTISILESQHHITIVEMVLVPLLAIICAASFLYTLDKYDVASIDFLWGFSIFTETENEINAIEDMEILKQKAILSTLFYLGLFKFLYSYHKIIGAPIVLSTVSLGVMILSLPTLLCLLFGSYIMNYIKGDSGSNSLLYAGVFDFATLLGFFKRFLVQFVRYALITAKLYLFDRYIYSSLQGTTLGLDLYMERRDINGLLSHITEDMSYYVIYSCEFVGELANIFIVYYAQLGAFVLVLF